MFVFVCLFVLGHIVYQFDDVEMMERFRPSLEEAAPIQNGLVALDYIGKRGSAINVTRKERIQYAREILQKEVLPHVGIEENNESKKAFFMGYVLYFGLCFSCILMNQYYFIFLCACMSSFLLISYNQLIYSFTFTV